MKLTALGLALAVAANSYLAFPFRVPAQPASPSRSSRSSPTWRPRLVPTLGPAEKVSAVAYSSDSRLVATGSDDGVVILWDCATGAEVRRFVGTAAVVAVQWFDRDRKVLAGGSDGVAIVWDAVTGVRLAQAKGFVANLAHDYLYGAPFAVSKDGALLFTADERGRGHLWDAASGRERFALPARVGEVGYAAFSPDAALLAVSGKDGACVFDLRAKTALWSDAKDSGPVAFVPDGAQVLTAGNEGIHLRDPHRGGVVRMLPVTAAWTVAFSRDGKMLLTATFVAPLSLWDVATAKVMWESASGERVTAAAFAPDGKTFASASVNPRMGSWESKVRLSDATSRAVVTTLEGIANRVWALRFVDGFPVLLAGDKFGSAFLWSGADDGTITKMSGHLAPVITGDISADGKQVLLGSLDNSASLWDAQSGDERLHLTGHTQYIADVAFSPDGRYSFTCGGAGFRWDTATGARVATFGSHSLDGAVLKIAPSPDGRYVFTHAFGRFGLWDASEGKPVSFLKTPRADGGTFRSGADDPEDFTGDGRLVVSDCAREPLDEYSVSLGETHLCKANLAGAPLGLSPDGKYVITLEGATTVNVAPVADPKSGTRFEQGQAVAIAALSEDNRFLLTAGAQDEAVQLWNVRTGVDLCSITTMRDGTWIVVDRDGRFDTNDIERIRGLSWVLDDDPMTPLPLEIFMRDFYTPQLLRQIMTDQPLAPIPSLAALNRVQPTVRIASVELESVRDATARVTVEVGGAKRSYASPDGPVTKRTGVQDLRLFRDGQIVASEPAESGAISLDPSTGKATVVFRGVQLPRSAERREVTFSAYAFNDERVKSATATTAWAIPTEIAPAKGTAYIVTFGVNSFENTAWNLRFAAGDARATRDALRLALKANGQFESVVPIALVSDSEPNSGEAAATKENLKVVLEALAGRNPSDGNRSRVPELADVRKATPQDLVVVSLSSHGYRDASGVFYCVPHDTGPGHERVVDADFVRHCVSSEDLTAWLRDVDSGQTVMILDACHSAAVRGGDFKPGPMGSRGLGQLAYDKRMKLLAATQADSVALELGQLRHGILTYALVADGLAGGQADFRPRDRTITVSEWLAFGASDVGAVQARIRDGRILVEPDARVPNAKDVEPADASAASTAERAFLQKAVFMDFARSRRETTLAGPQLFAAHDLEDGHQGASDAAEAEFDAAAAMTDPVAAAAALRRFVRRYPRDRAVPAARVLLVDTALKAGAPSLELVSAVRLATAYVPIRSQQSLGILLQRYEAVADELVKRGEYLDVAEGLLEEAIGFIPAEAGVVAAPLKCSLAKIRLKVGDREGAIGLLSSALKSAPDDRACLSMLAGLYADAGRIDEAIETYIQSASVFAEDPTGEEALLHALFLKKNGSLAGLDQRLAVARVASRRRVALEPFEEGRPAPNWGAKDSEGRTVGAGDTQDTTTVIVFWATWAEASRQAIVQLDELADRGHLERVALLAIAEEREMPSGEQARTIAAGANGKNFRVAFDSSATAARAFGVDGVPTVLVVDAVGMVRYRVAGLPDHLSRIIAAQLEEVSR